jgi:hypothetical protein
VLSTETENSNVAEDGIDRSSGCHVRPVSSKRYENEIAPKCATIQSKTLCESGPVCNWYGDAGSTESTSENTADKADIEDDFMGTGLSQESVIAGGAGAAALLAVFLVYN